MRKLDPREGQGLAQSHAHTATGSKTLRQHYSQRRNENGACYKEIGSQRKGRHTTPFIRNLIHTQLWKNDVSIAPSFAHVLLLLPGSVPPSVTVLAAFWSITPSPLHAFWEELSVKGPFTPLDKEWACDPDSTNHISP